MYRVVSYGSWIRFFFLPHLVDNELGANSDHRCAERKHVTGAAAAAAAVEVDRSGKAVCRHP